MALDDEAGALAKTTTSVDETGTPVVSIAGELDISNVNDIEQECRQACATSQTRLCLDLADVTFIDSSGLAMLVRLNEQVEHLSIRHPSRAVQRVVDATGLSKTLNLEQ